MRNPLAASLLAIALASSASAESASKPLPYSPYAGRTHPTRVFWGDTHHHTANSGDAFMAGDRLSPEQAYRFALGEEVVSSSGVAAQLARPLDFLCISDHAEGLGVMYQVYEGNPAMMSDATLARWHEAMRAGGKQAADAANEVTSAQAQGTLPKPVKDPALIGPVMKTVWQAYTETAEKFNDPGRFTAMIAYEWTSVPGGNNLHRNVLFRDGKRKADQILPFSAWQSEDPEKLWAWMDAYEKKTGGKLLAIPHNGNLSNGRMFALVDFEGTPLSKDYAQRRARWEPLQEMMQTKGASETHPTLSPNDEFADYGIAGWEYGNLTLEGEPETPEMRPYMYLRGGLLNGLALEQKLGTNPFQFGFIGGTDVHNSLTAIDEDNFFGKHVNQEPHPERWKHVSKQGFGKTRYTWQYTAAGYAGVWATENTREALWDAMMRKEVYATSGTRMTVRVFGGWDFDADDARTRDVARAGYAKGVPMGADLPAAPKGAKAPTFLIAALKDSMGANLDRIQVVKGWLERDGKTTHEKIYDVAWGDADRRKPDADGKLPPVGDTVDVARATWTDTIGDPDLTVAWSDPDFDAKQPAFYYVRVLEIPTPRWTAYDALRFGVKMSEDVPMKHQERAWTSPIWYAP
jgi:opacity protein-like surface antigen